MEFESNENLELDDEASFISGRSMVRLEKTEFQFIWVFSKLLLFHSKGHNSQLMVEVDGQKLSEVVLTVFLCLTKEFFFSQEFVSLEMCCELLQVTLSLAPPLLIISINILILKLSIPL